MEGGKTVLWAFLVLILIAVLAIYWFVPFGTIEFNTGTVNSNFSLNNLGEDNSQFYPNMRFPSTDISYRIENCPLQRQYDMKSAFDILSSLTILSFYPVEYGEEIIIVCQDTNEFEGNLFIAGEGGPTNITVAGDFNIIYKGKILLIKDSDCERPNIAIHELLHVLGFDHSENPNNIMYEISDCKQTIGEDTLDFINKIYSIPAKPDLLFEDIDAVMHGKYLDLNFSIRNNGLIYSGESTVIVYADGKKVKELDFEALDAGYGRRIFLTNVLINQINVDIIEVNVENDFSELDKSNNIVSLEIKK